MAGRRASAGLALAAVALSAAGCGTGGTTTVTSTVTRTVTTTRTVTQSTAPATPCTGTELTGAFKVVAGSGGAGQISYNLTLTNASQDTCYVSGLPAAVLLDTDGTPLPTKVDATERSFQRVLIGPGDTAHANARFSPSVPGPGDSQSGRCQPKAYTLQVTPDGGGAVNAVITPPTSVCESGTLNFDYFSG